MEPTAATPLVRSPLLRLLAGAAALLATPLALQAAFRGLRPPAGIAFALLVLAELAAYLAFVRLVERRSVSELAPRFAPAEIGAGLLVGATLFAATIGTIAALGDYVVSGRNGAGVLLPVLGASVMAGVVEELLVRGVVYRLLEEWLGTITALAVSALLFGAMHFFNPHAGVVPAVAVALEAGVLLAAAYVLTRRLWLPIGLHVAWNFTQSGIFGVAVSGYSAQGLLRGTLRGPELVSGGPFGAEASVFAVLYCLAAAAILLRLAARHGRFVPARAARIAGAPAEGQSAISSST